ncbi:MAG: histidine phosphatase family protein [Aerococcus sp.]|nr:histidine phosphatase family protein [Aerococcus sp.]
MTTTIYLIRHGQTENNRDKIVQGWFDSKLTEKGIEVAKRDGQALADVPFDAAYASDLSRAYDTASYILIPNNFLSPADIQKDPALREVSFGTNVGAYGPAMQQLLESKVEEPRVPNNGKGRLKAYVDAIKDYDPKDQAENYQEFVTRITTAMETIAKRHDALDHTILVVSHGMMIKTFFTATFPQLEDYPSMRNGGLARLTYHTEHWEKLAYDENIAHMPEAEANWFK